MSLYDDERRGIAESLEDAAKDIRKARALCPPNTAEQEMLDSIIGLLGALSDRIVMGDMA
jgi:hypothetical protein